MLLFVQFYCILLRLRSCYFTGWLGKQSVHILSRIYLLDQISTRTEAFIIDTLKLHIHAGPYLREKVFSLIHLLSHPFHLFFSVPLFIRMMNLIIYVMHGADKDILCLQRDFGIYICNLFDTGQVFSITYCFIPSVWLVNSCLVAFGSYLCKLFIAVIRLQEYCSWRETFLSNGIELPSTNRIELQVLLLHSYLL